MMGQIELTERPFTKTETLPRLIDGQKLLETPVHARRKGAPLAWLGQRGEDAYIFSLLTPLDEIICNNWSGLLSKWHQERPIFSLERLNNERRGCSSAGLQELADLWQTSQSREKRDQYLLPYKSVRLNEPSLRILAPDYDLVSQIDSKKYQRTLFRKWRVASPPSIFLSPDTTVSQVKSVAGSAGYIIAAPDLGSLGRNVQRIAVSDITAELLAGLSCGGEDYLCSEYIDGISVNTSAVILADSIDIGWPSVQILGEPLSHAPSEYAFCGNDFSATHNLDPGDIKELIRLKTELCSHIGCLGYRGFVGADWILDKKGQWWLLEINPRMQGSSLALTVFEKLNGHTPLVSSWLSEIGLREQEKSRPDNRSIFEKAVKGFQLIFYADQDRAQGPMALPRVSSGKYPEWYIVGMPMEGTRMLKGSQVCRIISPGCALSLHQNKLSSYERSRLTPVAEHLCDIRYLHGE
jgi:hypothetical protein